MKAKFNVGILLVFVMMLMSTQAFSQATSSCQMKPELQAAYEWDIISLTVKRMQNVNSKDAALVKIPQVWKDTIADYLAAIYNVKGMPQRDTVFDLYCIHNLNGSYNSATLIVGLDTNYAWTKQWKNNQTLTGYPGLDSFLIKYNLTLNSYLVSNNFAILKCTEKYNPIALADSIRTFQGIIKAEINRIFGGTTYIEYNHSGNNAYYDFSLGWGDCPSGCTSGRTWKFSVNSDCTVEYLGAQNKNSYNEPFPTPTYCMLSGVYNRNNSKLNMVSVFPNPFPDYTNLYFDNYQNNEFSLSVFDVTGREVRKITGITGTVLKVEKNDMEGGMYLYKLYSDKEIIGSGKFVIE